MKILAFDSTAGTASCAVLEDGRLLGLFNLDNGLTQSELLLPMAEDVMRRCRIWYSDIDLLCCSEGPGSFTGVRIAASLVKGIALSRDLPCVGVSTLSALAENAAGLCGIIVPVMDARRDQFYTAIFRFENGAMTRLTEDAAISARELCNMLSEYSGESIYLVGDGYRVAKERLSDLGITLCDTPELLRMQNAYSIGKLAYKKYMRGEYVDDIGLMPTYLRVPQAERERLERLKEEK